MDDTACGILLWYAEKNTHTHTHTQKGTRLPKKNTTDFVSVIILAAPPSLVPQLAATDVNYTAIVVYTQLVRSHLTATIITHKGLSEGSCLIWAGTDSEWVDGALYGGEGLGLACTAQNQLLQ